MKDNEIYYFEVGKGQWYGTYSFVINSWKGLRKSSMPLKYKALTCLMHFVNKVFGNSKIVSVITDTTVKQEQRTANNDYRVTKFGVTLFYSNENYALNPNGTDVIVKPHEQFGPIRFLFNEADEYSAKIHPGGMSSTYYIRLLDDNWIGTYTVAYDKIQVKGILHNGWATVVELLYKL